MSRLKMRRGVKCPCNGLEVAVQIGAIRRATTLEMSLEFEKKGRLPDGVCELDVAIYSVFLEAAELYNSCRRTEK